MTNIAFTKVGAAGNDLVLVDLRAHPIPDPVGLSVMLCDRHSGIGGDGLLTIESGEDGLPLVRMFNPDGSEDFCGNGLRCVSAWLRQIGEAKDDLLTLRTPLGIHKAVVHARDAQHFKVDVELVAPQFDPPSIPTTVDANPVLNYSFSVGGRTIPISCVSTGSTHTVIFRDTPVSDEEFLGTSPLIETHPAFPKRTSVLWCVPEGREKIHMRIWERSVGETLSCGTGTCAAVVVGRALGLAADRVEVVTIGGNMSAEWHAEKPVRLIGPANIIYTGEWVMG